jgi:hypothetical protein
MAARQKASFMPWIKKSRELLEQPETPPAAKFGATARWSVDRTAGLCLPISGPRTKAAQHPCTIMHVMCVKAVTSGKRGMKIAAGLPS